MKPRLKTKIMGIVNVTPDSFYAKSRTISIDQAIERALHLVKEGVDILDIGGESTRPNATEVTVKEELERVVPVFKALKDLTKVQLSIDTMKVEVAKACIEEGATLINDVTGFSDPKMRKLAQANGVDVCVMHMQNSPKTMQLDPYYERGVVKEVSDFLEMQAKLLLKDGVEPEHIIIDPGIGFGKTVDDNFKLVQSVKNFQRLGFKLLYGVSRKSFLSKFLNVKTDDLLSATLAVNSFLALSDVDIIRVHDVKEHKAAFDVLQKISL